MTVRFKDVSPVRASKGRALIAPAVFIVALFLGGAIFTTLGIIGLLLTLPSNILDRRLVELEESGIRIRTEVWTTIDYDEISSVENRTRDLFPGPMKWLTTPTQKQIAEALSNEPLAIHLKDRKWIWSISPIPVLLKRGYVDLYLSAEDEEKFVNEVQQRISRDEETTHGVG